MVRANVASAVDSDFYICRRPFEGSSFEQEVEFAWQRDALDNPSPEYSELIGDFISANGNFVLYVCKEFEQLGRAPPNWDLVEAVSLASEALWNSAVEYNPFHEPEGIRFTTLAGKAVRRKLVNYCVSCTRSLKRNGHVKSLDEDLGPDGFNRYDGVLDERAQEPWEPLEGQQYDALMISRLLSLGDSLSFLSPSEARVLTLRHGSQDEFGEHKVLNFAKIARSMLKGEREVRDIYELSVGKFLQNSFPQEAVFDFLIPREARVVHLRHLLQGEKPTRFSEIGKALGYLRKLSLKIMLQE